MIPDGCPGSLRRARPILAAGLVALAGCGSDQASLCDSTESTPLAAVQGTAATSPLLGTTVIAHGVVTARLDVDDPARAGFFLQSRPGAEDDDPGTSEALFVLSPESPRVGALVAARGRVAELGDPPATATSLVDVDLATCDSRVDLPLPRTFTPPTELEAVENMRVSISAQLTVTDVYSLGRRGQLRVAPGGMTFQPTEQAPPGPDAQAIARHNDRRTLVVDDGSERDHPGVISYLPEDIGLKNMPRAGDRVTGLTGVIDRRGFDRLHATERLTFVTKVRERRFTPPAGQLTVAAFNVLNYFNGDGLGGGFPTPRGAHSVEELARQEAKLVATILGLGLPDVVALMELENDGFGPESAVAQLTDAINARIRSPRIAYAYVRTPGDRLGSDEITVGLLYRQDRLELRGPAATLGIGPFADLNRQPLAQTFAHRQSGEVVTVVGLHLKSKSCRDAGGANLDQGDGQGCYNPARVDAIEALVAWLATDPTGANDPDHLLIGDLNAYTREDPVTALRAAGYVNLVAKFNDAPFYTFIYRGAAGSLDHAFASPSLAEKATGAQIWHINAAYAPWLDYHEDGKPQEIGRELYKASAVRASDHDPLVVSFR